MQKQHPFATVKSVFNLDIFNEKIEKINRSEVSMYTDVP